MQMMMFDVAVEFEFLLVRFIARVARVHYGFLVVHLHQVFASVVVADEDLGAVGTLVP